MAKHLAEYCAQGNYRGDIEWSDIGDVPLVETEDVKCEGLPHDNVYASCAPEQKICIFCRQTCALFIRRSDLLLEKEETKVKEPSVPNLTETDIANALGQFDHRFLRGSKVDQSWGGDGPQLPHD